MDNIDLAVAEAQPFRGQGLLREDLNLPVLPWLWQQVLGCLENPWGSLADLEAVIRQDQALSSRIISAANSSYYGATRHITSVSRASAVLGLGAVRHLCLAAGLSQLLESEAPQQLADSQKLWRHCLEVGQAASLLARGRRGFDAETAFTAGLLHDLGKVLLVARLPRAYRIVVRLLEREGLTWCKAEELLNVDHQELGLLLAEHWNLPPVLTEVIGRHHQPHPGLAHWSLVALVHLADGLVCQEEAREAGRVAVVEDEDTWDSALNVLGLDRPGLESFRRRYQTLRRLGYPA